jgi:hypothetical protein
MNADDAIKVAPSTQSRLTRAAAALGGALLLAALCLRAPWAAAYADGLEGRFEVRSADLELKDGVYHLNARIDLPVSDAVRRGLAEGVPLTLGIRSGHRAGAPAAAQLAGGGTHPALPFAVQRRERALHPAQRQQRPARILSTVDAALEQLSEVHGLPVLDKALITPTAATRRMSAPRSTTAPCRSRCGC